MCFGDPDFASGDLFTGMSRQKATWENSACSTGKMLFPTE